MKEANIAPFFACAYPALCDTARAHGYALAIHGSMVTDFDLIAVPWTDEAQDAEALKRALMDHIHALDYRHLLKCHLPNITEKNLDELCKSGGDKSPEEKPHGRLAWNLYLYNGVKVDLSVMPRTWSRPARPSGEDYPAL